MPGPTPPPDLRRLAAKAGLVASAFVVFLCGWLAMRATEWPRIVLYTVIALGAGVLASTFSRAARRHPRHGAPP